MCAGRTQTVIPRSTPATAANAVDRCSPLAKSISAAPSNSAAANGSEKNQAEYANTGVPKASINAASTAVLIWMPNPQKMQKANAAASAENVALLDVTTTSINRSFDSAGIPGSTARNIRAATCQGAINIACPSP